MEDGKTMAVEPSELAKMLEEHGEEAPLISLLEDIQVRYRYLPRQAMILVAERLGVPLSQIYSVATFYHAFSLKPRGKYLIRVCLGTACHVRGSERILRHLEKVLQIRPGETTADQQFTLETVNCLGACALGPVMVVENEYFGQMSPAKVDSALLKYANGEGESR